MRYGLLALSIAMLTGGGLAAQSAFAITVEATEQVGIASAQAPSAAGGEYGTMPFRTDNARPTLLAMK